MLEQEHNRTEETHHFNKLGEGAEERPVRPVMVCEHKRNENCRFATTANKFDRKMFNNWNINI